MILEFWKSVGRYGCCIIINDFSSPIPQQPMLKSIISNLKPKVSGIFPDKFEIAKVIPVYWKQDEKVFGNYRPISLSCYVSKVFERIVLTSCMIIIRQIGCYSIVNRTTIRREIDQKKTIFSVYWDLHDDVIKRKHLPRNWPFVREIHRSPVNFSHKGQWRGALMFSLIYTWINDWVNNREGGDLRRQHGHYDVIVMSKATFLTVYPVRWIRRSNFGKKLIETGVTQGSVLRPLVFVIYMNDIQTVSERLNFSLYADDTTLTST